MAQQNKAMTEKHIEQMKTILAHWDRYVHPFEALENPDEFVGVVLRDTYEGGTLMPIAFMIDIEKSSWFIHEIRTTENDYLEISLRPYPARDEEFSLATGCSMDTAL